MVSDGCTNTAFRLFLSDICLFGATSSVAGNGQLWQQRRRTIARQLEQVFLRQKCVADRGEWSVLRPLLCANVGSYNFRTVVLPSPSS